MDIIIEKKKGIKKYADKKYIPYYIGAVLVAVIGYFLLTTDTKAVAVKKENFNTFFTLLIY